MAHTVLIVDDHPAFRRLARRVLEDAGFDVVGEAADGASALTTARAKRPDAVLLDVLLPDMSGFEVSRRLATLRPRPVVVLTSSRSRADLTPGIDAAGADAFVAKADLTAGSFRAVVGST